MKKVFILVCFLMLIQLTFAGQDKNWQEFYNQSFDYFCNGEYEKAIECLDNAFSLDSSQPAIYWRLSYVLWLKAQRDYWQKRNIENLTVKFNEITEKGIKICEEILKSNSNNSEILFYLGALYGHRGQFIATTNHRLKVAFKGLEILGKIDESRKKLRLIEETESFYYRALGYLGFYNYGIVIAPKGFKKYIKEKKELSVKQTEEWGLDELKSAMKYGEYGDDTKFMYRGTLQIKIEDDESKDRISEAIELTEELLKKYPRNLSLRIDLIVLCRKNGNLTEAKKIGDELYQEISLLLKNSGTLEFSYIKYLYRKLAEIRAGIRRDPENKESS